MYSTNFGHTLNTETDFQLNVNEYYHIVKLAVIVEICRQTELMMSFLEHGTSSSFLRTITLVSDWIFLCFPKLLATFTYMRITQDVVEYPGR